MTTFLVTGAAGFIGSNLVESLLGLGHEVVGVDNFLTGRRENIDPFLGRMRFEEGDVRDRGLMTELCRGVDYVLHHAALASVPWSVEDPFLAHEHNATGTLCTLLGARDAGVKKVVMAVTSAAYGNCEELPSREDQPPAPLSPYAVTKLIGEAYLAMFTSIYDLPCVGLRYFNVFGPRQDPASAYAAAIPIFAKKILEGQSPTIFGDGTQTRDFVHVDDVVQANLRACEAGPDADGGVFNIGTGSRVTVNDLCGKMIELLGSNVKPVYGDERPGDAKHSMADISAARSRLGYEPRYTVMTGLEAAIDWYRDNQG